MTFYDQISAPEMHRLSKCEYGSPNRLTNSEYIVYERAGYLPSFITALTPYNLTGVREKRSAPGDPDWSHQAADAKLWFPQQQPTGLRS